MTTDGQRKFLSALSTLITEGRFCDIEIELSDVHRKFNRLVLAALSPFFDAMLLTSMKEGLTSVIKLPTVSSYVFDAAIAYYIDGEGYVDEDMLHEFMDASEMMLLPDLKELCLNKMRKGLVPRNCIQVWLMLQRYKPDAPLASTALQMIFENFEFLSMQCDFSNLSQENVLFLLRHRGYIIDPKHVFEAVFRWIESNKPDEEIALGLVKQINLSRLEPSFILKNVYREILKQYKRVAEHLKDYVLHVMPAARGWKREHELQEVVIVCSSSSYPSRVLVHIWDLKEKRWFEMSTSHPGSVTDFAAALVDLKLVLSGGCRNEHVSSASYILDTMTGRWCAGPIMLSSRCHHGSVTVQGSVYIVGGLSTAVKQHHGNITYSSHLNAIEEWSSETNRWDIAGHLPTAVADSGVVVSGQYILVIGGNDGSNGGTDEVQCFDVVSKYSFIVHRLPNPVKFLRADIFTQQVYFIIHDHLHILTLGHCSDTVEVRGVTDIKLPNTISAGNAVVVLDGQPVVYTNSSTTELNLSKPELVIRTLPTVPLQGSRNTVQCAFRSQIATRCYRLQ